MLEDLENCLLYKQIQSNEIMNGFNPIQTIFSSRCPKCKYKPQPQDFQNCDNLAILNLGFSVKNPSEP